MSKWTKFGAMVLVATMAAACGDDGSPSGDTLTQSEKTALTSALASTEFGGLAAFVVQTVGAVGTLDAAVVNAAISKALENGMSLSSVGAQGSAYEGAVGIAVQFDITSGTMTESGWFYGVIGWNGINTSNNTVDEIVLVGGSGDTGTLPTSASGTIESGDIFAFYETPSKSYVGTTGEASVSSSSFSGSTDCSETSQGITVDCSYATGTMNGDFLFGAMALDETAYTQSKVDFQGLPAVRVILSITQ